MSSLLSRRTFLGTVAAAGAATMAGRGTAWAGDVAPADVRRIHRVAIHPAVGIARVGNSRDAFILGPEVPGQVPEGPFKDADGAMAPQAARFRIYAYDRDGVPLGEVTAADADITWHVDVANTKAAWYGVDEPLDIPDSPPIARRNAAATDRSSLMVRATPRRLQGAGAGPLPLDGGAFVGIAIRLGEVATDEQGRLLVFPGDGAAYSLPGAEPLGGFADNDGWTDNTCDGPVRATVRVGGRVLEADPAWVVCGSPNFAPGMAAGLVTLYDSIEAALVEAGRRPEPATDFSRDVWPILARITDMQWVNAGYLASHGFGSRQDWGDERWRRRLADLSDGNRALRERVASSFRDPSFAKVEPDLEPQLYGDAVTMPPNLVQPRQWLAITPLQYRHLQRWAMGRCTDDRRGAPSSFDDFPAAEQPTVLDRAALDACLGGAFHPGVEFPWLARVARLWTADMRLRNVTTRMDRRDYGPELTAEVALSRTGPLARIGPGGITQWMGVPWHADSASCRVGYQKAISLISPGFWPARIPNHVLAEQDYRVVVDADRSLDERRRAFERRREWERFIARPTRPPTLALMVQEWPRQGVVRERPGPPDGEFPARLLVESDVGYDREPEVEYGAWMWVPQLPMFPLVVANSDDNSLRSVTRSGSASVLALSAPLGRPEGIARDASGNLYVCCLDSGILAKVTPAGQVSTLASGLTSPVAVTADTSGNLYVACFASAGSVVKVAPDGATTVLVPPGAGLVSPVGIALTPDGALLVSNATTGNVSRIDPQSGAILDLGWISGVNGPRGMAFDAHFDLFLAVRFANTVLRFDVEGTPKPLALSGTDIGLPFGVAVDAQDRLYVSNSARNLVNRIVVSGGQGRVTDFATGMPNPGGIVFNG